MHKICFLILTIFTFRERKYGTLSQSFMKINSMCKNDVTYRFKSNPDFTTDGTKNSI